MLAALAVFTACGEKDNDVPLIFAAASLADVLTEAGELYEAETGRRVEFSFGGSTALSNQIARLNAPADGAILAGDGPLRTLIEAGSVEGSDAVTVARNSLVVVSEDDVSLGSLSELAESSAQVAIADPELAPAGDYARQALISAGAWEEVSDRIVPTLDVRAALAAVGSGSVEFAIVYSTDALSEADVNLVLTVDQSLHQPIMYPAAAISGSSRADAMDDFVSFLRSPDGEAVFERHGFLVD